LPARLRRSAGQGAVRKGQCQSGKSSAPANDPNIRYDLVARVRREIANGTYDTEEKLDAALARLLERLDLS
jgi:anti-sigma28 factor (negative regulator of flagellin synthesis)